jgi:hypothetical protein
LRQTIRRSQRKEEKMGMEMRMTVMAMAMVTMKLT